MELADIEPASNADYTMLTGPIEQRGRLSLIKPFRALRPAPGRAAEVLAPPYDVLSSAEARERAKGKPWSFLHISKPEIDLDPGDRPLRPRGLRQGCGKPRPHGRRPAC